MLFRSKIGTGEDVTTQVVVDDLLLNNANLVPVGQPGTTSVDLTFSVLWSATGINAADAAGKDSTLTISAPTYSGLGTLTSAQIDAMFDFVVVSGAGSITEGVAQDVVITITFALEPASQAIYNMVANGTLAISFTFTVSDALID